MEEESAALHDRSAHLLVRLIQRLALLEQTPFTALDDFEDGAQRGRAVIGTGILQPFLEMDAIHAVVVEQDGQQQPAHLFQRMLFVQVERSGQQRIIDDVAAQRAQQRLLLSSS